MPRGPEINLPDEYAGKAKETREINFETAKKDLLGLLNTPFHKLRKETEREGARNVNYRKAILSKLKEKLSAFTKLGPANEVKDFLKNLLINDRADASNMPPLFSQTYEEAAEDNPYIEYDGYLPDVFDNRSENDSGETYRTYYYSSIIEALASFGPEAKDDLVECLKEIDTFVDLRDAAGEKIRSFKLGKDITESHFGELEAKEQEKNEIDIKYIDEGGTDFEVAEINKGNVGIDRFEIFGEKSFIQLEFSGPEKLILGALSEIDPGEETIKYLIDRIKTRDLNFRIFFEKNLEIFNKAPETAGRYLMDWLNQEKDPCLGAIIKQILYRLELGKIGMSEEGVDFLGKTYDLGQSNSPDNFAHRITADGKIAIFDEKNRALGYFQLHGLDSPEKKIKTEMLLFTYETLFRPKKGETPEERAERLKILEQFKEKYFETYLVDFHKETGLRLSNLDLAEQGWFLWYIHNADEKDKKRAKQFIAKYGEVGFKAFLSLEHDRQNGDRILAIGEKLDLPSAKAIFEKYSSITREAKKVSAYLHYTFSSEKNFNEDTINSIVENLLRRGKDLLVLFANQAETAIKQGEEISDQQIMNQLDNIRVEIMIFASTFKEVSAKQKIEFGDIAGTTLEIKNPGELTAGERKEMERIFTENRSKYPKNLLAASKKELKEALRAPDKKFYLLAHEGRIVSFMRLDRLPNGNLYAGSLNVRPEVRGSAIGSAMLKTALDEEARNHTIEAVVYEKNPMLKHYLEDFGFEIVGEIPDYQGTGQKFFKIERPRQGKVIPAKNRPKALPKAA